jgi:hypothetical protein
MRALRIRKGRPFKRHGVPAAEAIHFGGETDNSPTQQLISESRTAGKLWRAILSPPLHRQELC